MTFLSSPPRPIRAALAAAGLALLAGCASPPGRSGGDPERGAAVVTQWCGTCHAISGVETDKTRAPTYAQIAQRPGRDAAYLARFLEEDHFPMTTYRLLDAEKADVIALIVSLKD
jgi:mono/diheme cytochrome c family protein